MSDIVERLRSHLDVFRSYPKQTGADDMAGVVQSIELAADEIEKLRAQVDLVEQLRRRKYKEPVMSLAIEDLLEEAADEIERLRAQVVSLQSSLDAGPPRPGKKTP